MGIVPSILSLFILLGSNGTQASPAATAGLPSRTDCIVRVVLDPEPSDQLLLALRPLAIRQGLPLGSVSKGTDGAVYFQFVSACPHRTANVETILLHAGVEPANFTVDPSRIQPSPATLDVCGPYWSDCADIEEIHESKIQKPAD